MQLINTAWAQGVTKLRGLDSTAKEAGFVKKTLEEISGSALNIVLSLIGILFLILMIYGGMIWMTAQGNEEQVGKARKLIIAAVIGLIIVVAAFAITSFLGDTFGPQTINNYNV